MSFFDHLPILTVLLPALTAVLLLLLGDQGADVHGGHAHPKLLGARRIGLVSTALGLVLAVLLALGAADGELRVYRLGAWPAPYGIALVVDRLGAAMLLLTSVIALAALWYAAGGWDAHGRYFHAIFQFQLMGLNGAFVTGDLFNLFVFFEVLLIASYVLMVHGQGGPRLRAGLQYVVLNLLASALFLIGVALIYAQTGTLNFADLALRVAQVPAPEAAVLQAAALVLLVVFGFKAAMMPLTLWLPATYAAASAPVAALFAVMTKVGIYAIVRVHGVIFGEGAGDSAFVARDVLLPLALATGVVGVLGVLAARTLPRLVAWLNVASIGTVLAAVGLYSPLAWSAAIFYMLNSSLVIAGLFLLSELVAAQRGDVADRLVPALPVAQPALLGLMLLLASASTAGLPPLPGFIGKLMILEASLSHSWQAGVWSVVLGVGFLTIVGLARAGSILFWQVRPGPESGLRAGASPKLLAATWALLLGSVAMSVLAAPIERYTRAAAEQLSDRAGYARAVLGEGARPSGTVRPYDGRGARPPLRKEGPE